MATELQLLQDLAVIMGTAGLTAVIMRRLNLPLVFGFLVAGFIVGPHSPPFNLISDEQSIQTLANLGVVLLLFGLGLDFNLRHLRRLGGVTFVVMSVEVLLMLWLGFELGGFMGWGRTDSIFLGAMISISSTAIIVKVLRDLGRLNEQSSQIVFGVLVLEDIAAVLMLAFLSGYAATGDLAIRELGIEVARMLLFLLGTILIGLLLVPRVVDYVARQRSPDILVITVLGMAFGLAILSDFANFHVGLGAFLMGALMAEAQNRDLIEQAIRPVHDVFAAIFFVSIGTLVDISALQLYWKPIVAVVLLIVVGKLLSGALATFLVGYPMRTGINVGAALAQMGEFSFVIATLGLQTGVTSPFLFPIIVGAAAISSLTAPLMIQHSERIAHFFARLAPAPFITYVRLYTRWMGTLRSRGNGAERARRKARRSALLSGILIVAALGAAWFLTDAGRGLLASQGLREPAVTLTYWGLVLAATLPFLIRFFQAVNRWIATWGMPEDTRRSGAAFRRTVKLSLYLLGSILFGLPILAATSFFLSEPLITVAWIGMVASSAVILWASINRLHTRIESNVQALLEDERLPLDAPQVVRDLLGSDFPWEIRIESTPIEGRTWASGQRLGELGLRSATGASIILVERGDTRLGTPGPDTLLLPGDRVTLLGTREQISSARAVLGRPMPTGPVHTELRLGRLYVSEASELDGVRLADAALPTRSGLQVVAILREQRAIPNPGADERLRPGDVILVLGGQEQIAAATALVGPKSAPPAAAASP